MRYLIDTHYILWTLFEPDKLSDKVVKIFEDDDLIKFVSPISFWEISLKYSIGKLTLGDVDPQDIYDTALASGFDLLSVEDDLFVSYFQLPLKENHKDPFDRMLIWQAINNDLTFITKDRQIETYAVDGLKIESGK